MPIPYLTVADPIATIEQYQNALGARLVHKMMGPNNSIMHAELEIHGHRVMLSGEWPGFSSAPAGRSPVNFMIYVDNADDAYNKAITAGMESSSAPETMFWGDRNAKVTDGQGYEWTFAHKVEEVSDEEMQKRADDFAASFST